MEKRVLGREGRRSRGGERREVISGMVDPRREGFCSVTTVGIWRGIEAWRTFVAVEILGRASVRGDWNETRKGGLTLWGIHEWQCGSLLECHICCCRAIISTMDSNDSLYFTEGI